MKNNRLVLIATCGLLSFAVNSYADTPPVAAAPVTPPPVSNTTVNAVPAPTPPLSSSNAVAFGMQAGALAGTAQACGQDISVFTKRVGEALNKLAVNDADRVSGIAYFQRSLQQAQTNETNNHTIPCSQVMQDFNNLPLMKPDYEQVVLPQLNPTMSATGSTPSTTTAPATANPTAPNAAPAVAAATAAAGATMPAPAPVNPASAPQQQNPYNAIASTPNNYPSANQPNGNLPMNTAQASPALQTPPIAQPAPIGPQPAAPQPQAQQMPTNPAVTPPAANP